MSYAEDNNLDTFDGNDILYYSDKDIEYISLPAWRMKDNSLIAIKDMKTSHIKNCIKMIYRSNSKWRHQYLRFFEEELRERKYADSEI